MSPGAPTGWQQRFVYGTVNSNVDPIFRTRKVGAQSIVFGDHDELHTSTDEVNWSPHQFAGGAVGVTLDVAFAAGLYLAFFRSGSPTRTQVYTSPTLVTWTPITITMASQALFMLTTAPLFSFVTGSEIFTSPDGVTWTPRAHPSVTADNYFCGAYGNATYVFGGTGGRIIYSVDGGVTWLLGSIGVVESVVKMAFGNGVFVAATNANKVFYSADGITWIASTNFGAVDIKDLAFGSGRFVIAATAFAPDPKDCTSTFHESVTGASFPQVGTNLIGVTLNAVRYISGNAQWLGVGHFSSLNYFVAPIVLNATAGGFSTEFIGPVVNGSALDKIQFSFLSVDGGSGRAFAAAFDAASGVALHAVIWGRT